MVPKRQTVAQFCDGRTDGRNAVTPHFPTDCDETEPFWAARAWIYGDSICRDCGTAIMWEKAIWIVASARAALCSDRSFALLVHDRQGGCPPQA